MSKIITGSWKFHSDPNFNYQLNRWTILGNFSPEKIKSIAKKIITTDDWCREFLALAIESEKSGDLQNCAFYYRAIDFFLPYSDPRKDEIYQKTVSMLRELHKEYFETNRIQEMSAPYKSGKLPVWKVESATGNDDTILFCGGFDALKEELIPSFIELSNMGYRVYFFEGPGQGEVLNLQNITMTHEWEEPVKTVLDYYNLENITLIGLSLGGYLAPRAALEEPRISRVVSWGVMHDFFDVVVSRRGKSLEKKIRFLLNIGADSFLNFIMKKKMSRDPYAFWGIDHGMKVMGADTPAGYLRKLSKYTLKGDEHKLKQDLLLTSGNKDHFVPIEHLHRMVPKFSSARSITSRIFTEKDNADNHCQFGNIPLTLDCINNWIQEMKRTS